MAEILGKIVYSTKERLLYDPLFRMPKVRWQRYRHLRIRMLHSIEHKDIAWKYHSNQVQVLSEFGVKSVGSIQEVWWENPMDYMFVVEDVYSGEMGAGIRLTVADNEHQLPIEKAIKNVSPDIVPRIHKFDNVIAEVCGMWVKKTFSERGLAMFLNNCVISVALKLRVRVILAFPPPHTLPIFSKLGYTRVRIGQNAEYAYPDERYISTALEIDPINLASTSEEIKNKIAYLRANPVQEIKEYYKGYITKIDYRLRL